MLSPPVSKFTSLIAPALGFESEREAEGPLETEPIEGLPVVLLDTDRDRLGDGLVRLGESNPLPGKNGAGRVLLGTAPE